MSEETAEKAPRDLVKMVKGHINRILIKGREKRDQVRLQTLTREYIDIENEDGSLDQIMVYTMRTSVIDRKDLPGKAVHVSGKKGTYALVDMDPQYPDYITGDGEFCNTFDAQGYYWYYLDERMSKGFDAVGKLAIDKPLDLKMMAMIGVGALVAVWIFSKML